MVPEITTMYTFIYTDLKTTYFHKGKTWNYINENSLCIKYNMQIKYLNKNGFIIYNNNYLQFYSIAAISDTWTCFPLWYHLK